MTTPITTDQAKDMPEEIAVSNNGYEDSGFMHYLSTDFHKLPKNHTLYIRADLQQKDDASTVLLKREDVERVREALRAVEIEADTLQMNYILSSAQEALSILTAAMKGDAP